MMWMKRRFPLPRSRPCAPETPVSRSVWIWMWRYPGLKLMKADHQSKQYRLEDQLLKYFPEEIETNKGLYQGL